MSATLEPLPNRAWLMVGLLWFVALLNYLDRLILITMRTSIKASDAGAGVTSSRVAAERSTLSLSSSPLRPLLACRSIDSRPCRSFATGPFAAARRVG